ncbi:MAG: hypothetical protein EBS29_14840, partial [Chloroflexia bacterium]|nr:hypothetical protein [Chloroflexia bacterium]
MVEAEEDDPQPHDLGEADPRIAAQPREVGSGHLVDHIDIAGQECGRAGAVIGAVEDNVLVTVPDRIERVATIAERWVRLRRKPPQERRVAMVLYNYPPGLGRLGTAALLNVPATLHALLTRLKKENYKVVNLPESVAELTKRVSAMEGGQGEHVAFAVAQMREVIPDALLRRVDAKWGAAPGEIAPKGRDAIRLDGFELGNVFVGVQPPLGVPGDPMRMLFDHEYAPHHQFLAFYRYLIDVWQADAIVHVGMHGTAEWLPGLQLGLTGECWPDIVMGDKKVGGTSLFRSRNYLLYQASILVN